MKDRFQVGDRVRIKYEYWERLSKTRSAIKLYVNNGPDYVYTVCAMDEDGAAIISYEGDEWNHPELYLEFADTAVDEDIISPTLVDVL